MYWDSRLNTCCNTKDYTQIKVFFLETHDEEIADDDNMMFFDLIQADTFLIKVYLNK